MSGETKCPCCGNTLKERVSIDGLAIVHECQTGGCFFRCNCMMVDKICAAMELARLEYSFDACKSEDEHKYQELIALARKQVVEVFK